MKVVILQPHFLPFTGYFDLMNRADIFVYYDTVQFVRRSWHCRTYINENGSARWLSAAVKTCDGSRHPLYEMEFAENVPWRQKVVKRLEAVYAHNQEPHILRQITGLLKNGSNKLCDWNIEACEILASELGIGTKTLRSSELKPVQGNKQDKILNLCLELGASHYICGPGSRHYIQDEVFAKSGIEVEWVKYDYKYKARTLQDTDVFPSIIDMILSIGTKAVQNAIRAT